MTIKIPNGFKKCVCAKGLMINGNKCYICNGKGYYSKKFKELKILVVQNENNTIGNIKGVSNIDALLTIIKLCFQEIDKL